MNEEPVWRYLTLAKYVDLLGTRSLFFPKAALFEDETEGKWYGHSVLYEASRKWPSVLNNARKLEALLERAGDDPDAILLEAARLHQSEDSRSGNLRDVLAGLIRVFPHKRREYVEMMISSWTGHYDKHNQEVETWYSQTSIHRESTYISCWNRASSMSLAMWEMYGKGREAVAIRSSVGKLNALLENNAGFLEQNGLNGQVVDVRYIDGLKNPDERVQDRIYEILEESDGVEVMMFRIKPDIYSFEQEVRAVLYPKRDIFAPLVDPHPSANGFSLQFGSDFIEAVYIHPALNEDSMMTRVVEEINARFGANGVPVIADKVEAFGKDIRLEPRHS
ncbi:MAG: hypothetical protein QOH49_2804 [Acidobacteriota bacterium]|jgi:hypothetical protein|nr:hypothetical protein [Acidobacteriota bacterium]